MFEVNKHFIWVKEKFSYVFYWVTVYKVNGTKILSFRYVKDLVIEQKDKKVQNVKTIHS